MLTATESAKQELKRILLARTDDPDLSLRLEGEPGQFRIKIDSEVPGDQVLEYEGTKVLLLEPALAFLLGDANIDVQDTPEGPRLVVLGIE
jgi:Fe-S cluster assembly iron-binding protein IscA